MPYSLDIDTRFHDTRNHKVRFKILINFNHGSFKLTITYYMNFMITSVRLVRFSTWGFELCLVGFWISLFLTLPLIIERTLLIPICWRVSFFLALVVESFTSLFTEVTSSSRFTLRLFKCEKRIGDEVGISTLHVILYDDFVFLWSLCITGI